MSWKWSPFSEKVGGEFFFVFMDIVHHCFLRDEYVGSRSDAYSSKICWFVFQVGFHLYHYYLAIRSLIFPEKRKHILVLQCWTLIIVKKKTAFRFITTEDSSSRFYKQKIEYLFRIVVCVPNYDQNEAWWFEDWWFQCWMFKKDTNFP